jgi:hypothetical protein
MALRLHSGAALAGAAGILAAAAPAAAQPRLNVPLAACYVSVDAVNRQPIEVSASGFSPNARVDPYVDGALQPIEPPALADANGDLKGRLQAPWVPDGQRLFTLRLVDRDNPANVVPATAKVSALSVKLSPPRARPSRRVRFTGRGFTGAGAVWAHYLHQGQLRRTVRLAMPHGDCGTFSVRARQIPLVRPETGDWTVLVDQERRYAPIPQTVRVRLIITVRRVPRPS